MFDFINPFYSSGQSMPLLRDVFADWKDDEGIFDALAEVAGGLLPWADAADSEYLNFDYFGNHSGAKYPAPVVMLLLDDNEELTESARLKLANIIWTKFREPWSHLWLTNEISYNPIHNYNMNDVRTLVRGDSDSRVTASESSQSTEHGKTDDTTEYVYGLNTPDSDGKRSDRISSQEGGKTSTTYGQTGSSDGVAAREETETTQRSGNIGVTTTQQMMEAERNVWLWNFFDQVYKDIDTVLSLPIYDICRV